MQDAEKIDAFVVRNADYYRKRWAKFREVPGTFASFNWAACLGQVVWLAYRKLYIPLLWAVAVSVAYVWLWIYVENRQFVSASLAEAWSWFAGFVYLGVFGLLGNYAYWRKFQKLERQAASKQGDRDAQLRFIGSKGGTSPVAAWLVVFVLLTPVAWALYWGVYQASRLDFSAFVFDATGPLTLAEVEGNLLNLMDDPLEGARRECVFREIQARADAAGDPETLDPASVEFLPADGWDRLDPFDRRILLTQAIVTKAFFVCNRPGGERTGRKPTGAYAAGSKRVIVAGDPRFDVFELSNSAGDGSFADPDGTVLLTFVAKDSRYCRAARFSLDYTVVLACRNDDGWEIEAVSRLAAGESTAATAFGGGDTTEVTTAIRALTSGTGLLDEQEIIDAAGKGWQ